MKHLILSFLVVGLFANQSKANLSLTQPKLSKGQPKLGADVKKALKKKNINFKILQVNNFSKTSARLTGDIPMAAFGDYNADGIRDIVVYGVDEVKDKEIIYMVVSNKILNTYNVFLVDAQDLVKESQLKNDKYVASGKAKASNRDILFVEFMDGYMAAHSTYYFSSKKNKVISVD